MRIGIGRALRCFAAKGQSLLPCAGKIGRFAVNPHRIAPAPVFCRSYFAALARNSTRYVLKGLAASPAQGTRHLGCRRGPTRINSTGESRLQRPVL